MSLFNQLVKIVYRGTKKHKQDILPTPTSQVIKPKTVEREDKESITQAKSQAREIILEAKDEAIRIKHEAEGEIRQKLEQIEHKLGMYEEKERQLRMHEVDVENRKVEIEKIKQDQLAKLERAAGLTRDEAKKLILTAVEDRLKEEIAKRIKEAEATAREESEQKSREILVDAMRYGATNYVPEYTVSAVKLPDEEMKGRIIGKEGRNIRTFEQVTGVDVDLDEEGVIRLSSFDAVRREIAKVSLERLITDGRIQPSRIEELVEQTKKDIERVMFKEGEKLCHAVGVYNLPHDKIALLGRFKYRSSYGQNMIAHTLEETKIGIGLARELGADVNIVRLACLLHDIGKVITEGEGTHVQLGVDLLKRNNMPQKVIDCVAQHHEDTPFTSIEAVIVYIADAISGSRPGARYEDYAQYVKRLTELEDIARVEEGVSQAYAIQAGRELRVIVDPGKLDDASSVILAQKVKDEIQKKLTYPGQIKVTVIRETRATEVAQ